MELRAMKANNRLEIADLYEIPAVAEVLNAAPNDGTDGNQYARERSLLDFMGTMTDRQFAWLEEVSGEDWFLYEIGSTAHKLLFSAKMSKVDKLAAYPIVAMSALRDGMPDEARAKISVISWHMYREN